MSVNVHALATEVVNDSTDADPAVMAAAFVARIPKGQYREVLLHLSRAYIRSVIAQRRQVQTHRPVGGSRKVEAARAAWQRLLDTPEFVPSSGWIFFRDATAQQVAEMAAGRIAQAHDLIAVAERYSAVADAMKAAKAMRVADLPPEVLARLLDGMDEAA